MGITLDKQRDENKGSTEAFSGTANTVAANVPAVSGNKIDGAGIFNDGIVPLQISFDGGVTYFDQGKKSFYGQDIQGNITQIKVKTAASTADYRININFKDS